MKKIILFFFLILSSLLGKSQEFKYFGPMNRTIFSQMTPVELVLYHDCLKAIGEEMTNLTWATFEITGQYSDNKKKYKTLKVSKDNTKSKVLVESWKGKSLLNFEIYIIQIQRKGEKSKVEIYVLS